MRNYKDTFTFCVCGGMHQSKVVKEAKSSVATLLIQSVCKIKKVSNACWNIYTVMWLVLFCEEFLHLEAAGSGKIWSKCYWRFFGTHWIGQGCGRAAGGKMFLLPTLGRIGNVWTSVRGGWWEEDWISSVSRAVRCSSCLTTVSRDGMSSTD